ARVRSPRRRAVGKGISACAAPSTTVFEGAERSSRPLTLFARPVAVRALPIMHLQAPRHRVPTLDREREDVALARIDFGGETHHIAASWGPERIETGWWRGRQIARDYYLVETVVGRRLWLFRQLDTGPQLDTGRWFVHGAFD
ncbi:MAG: hypothetical protein U1E05_19755, partial [Patescibacteria group bacterium]|nr:hypothetical protein [Patescibacteria group bacterium]